MRYLLLSLALCFYFFSSAQDSALVGDDTSVVSLNPIIAPKDTVIFSGLDFESFRKRARFENKPYFIMFGASWCAPCHRIKTDLFTNKQIADLSNLHYLAYYIDLEDFDGAEINSKLFKVSQLPTIIFFDPQGQETDRAIGYFDGYYFFRKLRAHLPPDLWGRDWGE